MQINIKHVENTRSIGILEAKVVRLSTFSSYPFLMTLSPKKFIINKMLCFVLSVYCLCLFVFYKTLCSILNLALNYLICDMIVECIFPVVIWKAYNWPSFF